MSTRRGDLSQEDERSVTSETSLCSMEDSNRGEEGVSGGDSDASLFKTEEERKQFLEKIYEPLERSKVHGFDYDEKSLKMLLFNEKGQDSFKLIGVVGMLGVGKTTLCRLIFNEEEVKQHFLPRIWISMSESESMEKVVERILEHLGVDEEIINSISNDHKLAGLLYALHLRLKGKRFLIVLDDVRNGDKCMYYKNLVSCLSSGHGFPKGYGGAVIMSSRNEKAITKIVGDKNYVHRLLPLSDLDSCWAIYQNLDLDEAKKSEGQVGVQDPGPSTSTEDQAKRTERQESGADGSKEGKQELRKAEVREEVKEALKKKCGGFPLVARIMSAINQMQREENKPNDAAASIQAPTDSKDNVSDGATTASKK